MNGAGIQSALERLTTKEYRTAIAQLGSEWTVLDSVERLISRLSANYYEKERLQPGTERPPELVELESQQWEIFRRKREISAALVELEEGAPPKKGQPGRRIKLVVQVRDMFIRSCRHHSNEEICRRLDLEFVQHDTSALGLPENWTEKYGVKTYYGAYRHPNCKRLVQKLISAAKASY